MGRPRRRLTPARHPRVQGGQPSPLSRQVGDQHVTSLSICSLILWARSASGPQQTTAVSFNSRCVRVAESSIACRTISKMAPRLLPEGRIFTCVFPVLYGIPFHHQTHVERQNKKILLLYIEPSSRDMPRNFRTKEPIETRKNAQCAHDII